MREEKSKNQARTRRERENGEFTELRQMLPLQSAITMQLDKVSIIRLTCSYLKLRTMYEEGFFDDWAAVNKSPDVELTACTLQSLDGFVFVLSNSGHIRYISETASVHLGLSQVELIGNSIYDYMHADDRGLLESILLHKKHGMVPETQELEIPCSFIIRLRCVLPKRNAGLTVENCFKVVHCMGQLKLRRNAESHTAKNIFHNHGLLAIGYLLSPAAVTEVKLNGSTFMIRTSMDMKVVFADAVTAEVTKFDLCDVIDQSLYRFVHPEDIAELRRTHTTRTMLSKQQAITTYYRLLAKGGGWIRLYSHLAIVHSPRTAIRECVIFVNHAISQVEHPGEILCAIQKAENRLPLSKPQEKLTNRLGLHSERFYGPHGSLLVQSARFPDSTPATADECGTYHDQVTGEQRFCLRTFYNTSDIGAAATITNGGYHAQYNEQSNADAMCAGQPL